MSQTEHSHFGVAEESWKGWVLPLGPWPFVTIVALVNLGVLVAHDRAPTDTPIAYPWLLIGTTVLGVLMFEPFVGGRQPSVFSSDGSCSRWWAGSSWRPRHRSISQWPGQPSPVSSRDWLRRRGVGCPPPNGWNRFLAYPS